MKKIISISIVAVILAAMLASTVSAGAILWSDDFNSGEFKAADWQLGGTLFEVQQGGPTKSPHLEGWAEAVVQQSSYGDEAPAPRVYAANIAFKCDSWFYDDGGNQAEEHWVGLWWADYFNDIGDPNNRIVYTIRVNYERRAVILTADGVGDGETYFPEFTELAVWTMPDSYELVMDTGAPTVFNMGLRINGTQIDGFFNDQKVVSFTAPRMGTVKSPLIFWNYQCWTGYDNWVVADADYNLFNESAEQAQNQQNAPAATEKVIETKKVVVGTDEDGNDITEIVTEEVVRPAAQTSNGTSGGTSSATGDMAVVVAALMVIALGSAIVVRKVTLK